MISILSIDGGGIRGIIPAAFLTAIETCAGKPVSDLFDLIAGTSTGGILAAALTVPDARGRPKYAAAEVRALYFEHGGAIFHRSPLRKAATLGGLARPRYAPDALDRALQQYMGEARLHQTTSEILVTAYDMASATPWFFKTSFARHNRRPADDPFLWQVARATASAPTYFPPLSLGKLCLVDGGVFASNPALCAYAQARNMFPLEREMLLVSLGTGLYENGLPCAQVETWGIANWAVPISDVMLNAASATVDYQLRAILGKSYRRFQIALPENARAMDDASPENLLRLEKLAEKAVRGNAGEIDRLCRALT